MQRARSRKLSRKVAVSFKNSLLIAGEILCENPQSYQITDRTHQEETEAGIQAQDSGKALSSRPHSVSFKYTPNQGLLGSVEGESVISFKDKLQEWSVKNRVKHTAVSSLLKILKSEGHEDLPNDARSL